MKQLIKVLELLKRGGRNLSLCEVPVKGITVHCLAHKLAGEFSPCGLNRFTEGDKGNSILDKQNKDTNLSKSNSLL